jgi:hypothetical protein
VYVAMLYLERDIICVTRWLAKSGNLSLGVDLVKGAQSTRDRTSLTVHTKAPSL